MKRNNKKIIDRVMSVIMLFTMIFCLVGCDNAAPAIGEDVVSTKESSIEVEEKEIPDGMVPAAAKPVEEETSPTEKPATEQTETTEPESTEPPHVHNFKVESSTEATCAEAGERKLVCECGESQIESVPATGNHNWKEVTTVINHPELGHVEITEVQIQVGTTVRTEYECAYCGERFDSPSEKTDHCAAFVPDPHGMARTIAYDYTEPVYDTKTETVFVVDTPAWEETVVTGYTCTICGANK